MAASSFDNLIPLMRSSETNSYQKLRRIHENICRKLQATQCLTEEKVAEKLRDEFIFRDLDAEIYIPTELATQYYCLRSDVTGNCLFSSVSIILVGDNSLVSQLRTATSLELFLYCEYYCKHPNILSAFNQCQFSNFKNFFALLVSHDALDSDKTAADLLKEEACLVLKDKAWSSLVCILALSTVICRNIETHYPDCGTSKLKLLFKQRIQPRDIEATSDLQILCCSVGPMISKFNYKHNHYAPLLSIDKCNCSTTPLKTEKIAVKKIQSKIMFNPSESINMKKRKSSGEGTLLKAVKKAAVRTHVQNEVFPEACIDTEQAEIDNVESLPGPSYIALGNDIGKLSQKVSQLSDSDLLDLAGNIFVPESSFKFPTGTKGRKFNYKWLEMYSWLRYSSYYDGGFCMPCVLFAHKFPNLSNCKNLIIQPVRASPGATTLFDKHTRRPVGSKKNIHGETMKLYATLLSQQHGSKSIQEHLNEQLTAEREENRNLITPVIETILCGRLGIPLRGHRDDLKFQPAIGEYSLGGTGNFMEILNYHARANPVMKEIFDKAAKNARYVSKTAQDDIINCIGQVITNKILAEVKESKFFSILGDECMDSANKEQFSLCLRFVDSTFNIREEFIRFIPCSEGLSGEALKSVLLKCLQEDLNLNILNCRGQGYDGAGAVAGIRKGLATRILEINSKAPHVHCYCHRLNLSIISCCQIQAVKSVMEQIKDISYFFNLSENRQIILETNIKEHSPDSKRRKLFDVCRTRWIERIKGMDVFDEFYIPIVHALEDMHYNIGKICNSDTSTKATIHLKVLTSFDFLATFMILKHVFMMTLPVTTMLQSKTNDIMDGIHLIESLKLDVDSSRSSVQEIHDQWYEEALSLARKINVNEDCPRIAAKQKYRSNVPFYNSPSEYFLRSITVPLLDHISSELKFRFSESVINVYNGLAILPSKMKYLRDKGVDWKAKFKLFAMEYFDDLPAVNYGVIEHELELWRHYWETFSEKIPCNISGTLKLIAFAGFENIKTALVILGTLPVTSCECERSFSAMKLLKTKLRSTMVSDRFNGLALMYIHKEIIPKVSDVIEEFTKKRRLDFSYHKK